MKENAPKKLAQAWVREFVRQNPTLPVDRIASAAKDARHALHKSEIAIIRREVHKDIFEDLHRISERKPPEFSVIPPRNVKRCSRCKKEGHWAIDCPNAVPVSTPDPGPVPAAPQSETAVPPVKPEVPPTISEAPHMAPESVRDPTNPKASTYSDAGTETFLPMPGKPPGMLGLDPAFRPLSDVNVKRRHRDMLTLIEQAPEIREPMPLSLPTQIMRKLVDEYGIGVSITTLDTALGAARQKLNLPVVPVNIVPEYAYANRNPEYVKSPRGKSLRAQFNGVQPKTPAQMRHEDDVARAMAEHEERAARLNAARIARVGWSPGDPLPAVEDLRAGSEPLTVEDVLARNLARVEQDRAKAAHPGSLTMAEVVRTHRDMWPNGPGEPIRTPLPILFEGAVEAISKQLISLCEANGIGELTVTIRDGQGEFAWAPAQRLTTKKVIR